VLHSVDTPPSKPLVLRKKFDAFESLDKQITMESDQEMMSPMSPEILQVKQSPVRSPGSPLSSSRTILEPRDKAQGV